MFFSENPSRNKHTKGGFYFGVSLIGIGRESIFYGLKGEERDAMQAKHKAAKEGIKQYMTHKEEAQKKCDQANKKFGSEVFRVCECAPL